MRARATVGVLAHHGIDAAPTRSFAEQLRRCVRRLTGLAAAAPAWVRSLRDPVWPKRAQCTEDYPGGLERGELRGMLAGPFAYTRSRRMQRKWAP
jgi:hypothetical protein